MNKSDENLAKCMDEKTITNMVNIGDIVENPLSMFQMKNIKSDLNLFGEFAQVAGDLSACHFESTGKDIWDMCKQNEELCSMETITQNITKSLFVLMGKLTGLAETLKSFPAEEEDEYREQMRELGSDAGTFLRVIFSYETPENAAKIA